MKNTKNVIAIIALVGTIGISTVFAGDIGVGLADTRNQPQQCTETRATKDNADWGILVSDFVSSLFGNIGINFADDLSNGDGNVQVNCGILISE